ncbi:MAG: hypothetical protein V3575_06540 [Candidatus Absconditabacteria bacterium]
MREDIAINQEQDRFTQLLQKYLSKTVRHVLSIPFIWSPFVAVIILDFFIEFYHTFAFPLYGIPKVDRGEYIKFDRNKMKYLTTFQRVNCMYCSYVNGFIAYAMEIAGRTERYWCPLKYKNEAKKSHDWYNDFADYNDPKDFQEKYTDEKSF